MDRFFNALYRERTNGWPPLVIRVATGLFFISISRGKFFAHASETDDFDRYGIPFPAAMVIVVGVVELVCGIALVIGFGTRIAAAVLAANMIGAIATAGRVDGGSFHLGVAPSMLALMLVLVWAGPGRFSVDRVLASRRGSAAAE